MQKSPPGRRVFDLSGELKMLIYKYKKPNPFYLSKPWRKVRGWGKDDA